MFVILYFAISFVSAFLLFSVQPMAAKAVLPVLGGAPFVWNGCMLFFQTLLLGGYLYAHKAVKRLSARHQVLVHIGVLLTAFVLFPSQFSGSTQVDAAIHPLWWLLATLLASIGLPYFALSATAPMIQGWFSVSGHKRAGNPYFLYAASNLGSFGSLFCFIVFVEPRFPQSEQLHLLRMGFAVLVALFMAAGWMLYQHGAKADQREEGQAQEVISWERIGYWLMLSMVPSSLLYGVTQYITTDVASMPLLWVLPLALYLLTFVLVFSDKPRGVAFARFLHVPLVTAVMLIYIWDGGYNFSIMFLHLFTCFIVTMSCHGSLSESRPGAAQLTNFYLWVSLGGVLGGVFNTFIAPAIFLNVTEYPVMIVLSMLVCLKPKQVKLDLKNLDTYVPFVVAIMMGGIMCQFMKSSGVVATFLEAQTGDVVSGVWSYAAHLWRASIVVMLCFGAYRYRTMNVLFSVALVIGALGLGNSFQTPVKPLFHARNIFGVNEVLEGEAVRTFMHGTTMHGMQSLDEELRLKPVTYYAPVKMLFDVIKNDGGVNMKPIAVMGLGAGTLTCYGKKGQQVDVFEIDPLVLHIASDKKLFTYLSDCPATKTVEIGDARISIAKKEDKRYSAILMDAFTSDAVPAHLLTKEAIAMYMEKLADGGFVGIHISNRHLSLEPVITAIAQELKVPAYVLMYRPDEDEKLVSASHWVFLTHRPNIYPQLQKQYGGWEEVKKADPSYIWRDDFSNMLKVISFRETLRGLLE